MESYNNALEYSEALVATTESLKQTLDSVVANLNSSLAILTDNKGGVRLKEAIIAFDKAQEELAIKVEETTENLA